MNGYRERKSLCVVHAVNPIWTIRGGRMIRIEKNNEMSRQVTKLFHIEEITEKLNKMRQQDKMHYLNYIITTLLINCTKTPFEAVGFMESLKSGLINAGLK